MREVAARWVPQPRLRRRLLVVLLCLGLTMVPLVGGLGYENGFVLAPIFSLLGMAVAVDAVARRRDQGPRAGEGRLHLLLEIGFELGVLHALSVFVLLVGRLWQPSCDPLGGGLFYLAGPAISSVAGVACGLWGGVLAHRRRRQLAIAILPMVACVVVGLWRLYWHPVVFAYDPFFGYFSGSIYDEAISVGPTYGWYRAYNGLAIATVLGAWALFVDRGTLALRRPPATTPAAMLAVAVFAGSIGVASTSLRAASLGFTADTTSITEHLSGTYETEHFVLHYAPRSGDARLIADLALEHEFAWSRLAAIMGREPSRKVHSFIFESPQQKRALMGAGTVQVAAPWRYQIYLDHRGFPHPVLHHELAHVFGNTIGDPLLGISRQGLRVNIGLVEGLATALAPRASGNLDLHDQAKVLDRLQRRPAIASIMGPGFFAKSSRVAYVTAGSFCQWLIDTRGFSPMAELYRTAGDFEAAYGTPLASLEDEWLAFLRDYDGITDDDVEEQRQRFERTSVFERPCAHRVAEVRAQVVRATHRGRLEEAVLGQRELCALEPENPGHRMGLAMALANGGQLTEALTVLQQTERAADLTSSLRAALAERIGDVAMDGGHLAAARAAYARALTFPVHPDARRVIELKHLGASDPELAPRVGAYFGLFEPDDDGGVASIVRVHAAYRIRELPRYRALGSYLAALQLLGVQQADAAHPLLLEALADPAQLPSPEFVRAAQEQLLVTSLLTRDFERARETLAALRAAPHLGNGLALEYDEWEARLDFFARARLRG